ncbi:MAG: hypothetical protein IPG89_07490 [Bacteroidetes bacterium]|nr:hypothetical protein [Bacteroidota bacterium]
MVQQAPLQDPLYDAETMLDANSSSEYTVMSDNIVQADFEIKLPYTIPSDNKAHIVSVMSKELPTKYVYKAVPKLDMNAYLTARNKLGRHEFITRASNFIFSGTYVGQTYLNSNGNKRYIRLNTWTR